MNNPGVLHESLYASAERWPDQTALICQGERLTFSELYGRARRLAVHLIQQGIDKGDRCLIFMDNGIESVIALYAVFMSGAAAVVLNPQVKSGKLAYIAENCQARAAFVDRPLIECFARSAIEPRMATVYVNSLEEVGNTTETLHHSLVTVLEDAALDTQGDLLPRVIPSDLALLIYTSGSTGDPKAVVHTHCSVMFSLNSIIEYLGMRQDDTTALALPMSFDYGLYQVLMSVHLGARLVISTSFIYPAQVFGSIEKHGVTVFPAVPTLFNLLVGMHRKKPLCFPGVRMITSTAADLPAAIIPALHDIFPNARIFKMYGLTECKRVSYLDPHLIDIKPDSVGKPMPGVEVFVLDDNGNPVVTGETGMLYVRGCNLMVGYWGDPALTERVLVPGRFPGDRMLRTGDLFRQDEDGDLYFVGREDDIIKTRGEKVSPLEVENSILSTPGVLQAAVIGRSDPVLGESVQAFVVIEAGAEVTEKDILRQCASQLEKYMMPQRIVFMDRLPLARTGKVDRSQLQ